MLIVLIFQKLKTKEQIKTKTKLPNKKQRKTRESDSSSDEEEKEATDSLGKVGKESSKLQKVPVNSKLESKKKEGKKLKAKKKQEPSDESDVESDEKISSEGEEVSVILFVSSFIHRREVHLNIAEKLFKFSAAPANLDLMLKITNKDS